MFRYSAFGVIVIMFVFTPLLLITIQKNVLRPLYDIVAAAKRISSGHPKERIPAGHNDEIGILSSVINTMITMLTEEIDSRRKSEKTLRTTLEELRRSNRDLEQFAYVASHDLQEPLRKVANFTELFIERFVGNEDEKAQRYLRYIQDGTDRMRLLIQDLLKYSRVASDSSETEFCDINQIVEQTFRDIADQSPGQIVIHTLPVLRGVKAHFVQLFQNLIGNSVKYCIDRTSVRIEIGAEER